MQISLPYIYISIDLSIYIYIYTNLPRGVGREDCPQDDQDLPEGELDESLLNMYIYIYIYTYIYIYIYIYRSIDR